MERGKVNPAADWGSFNKTYEAKQEPTPIEQFPTPSGAGVECSRLSQSRAG